VKDFYALSVAWHKAFPAEVQDSFVIHKTPVVYPPCTRCLHGFVHSFIHMSPAQTAIQEARRGSGILPVSTGGRLVAVPAGSTMLTGDGTVSSDGGSMTDQHGQAGQSTELSVAVTDDYVATIEFSRPPSNFFSVSLIRQIADACDELAEDRRCRAIVLCSAGRVFCAGADLADAHAVGTPGGAHLYDYAIRLFEQPLPMVAAVQGAAIGGGLGLAMTADFRVAAPEARFAANFALLGFHHGFALTVTLPPAVGQQTALDLLYTGRRVGGEEAHRLGLADRLAESGGARAQAHALAAQIATSAPLAVRSIRATMRSQLAAQARAAMARERAEQDRLMQTADWKEGVAAVTQRRPAHFTGS
jgi:2-(1,2-epoxy-1,2-dihydrophenyl)acetyl-CoA isomerase